MRGGGRPSYSPSTSAKWVFTASSPPSTRGVVPVIQAASAEARKATAAATSSGVPTRPDHSTDRTARTSAWARGSAVTVLRMPFVT